MNVEDLLKQEETINHIKGQIQEEIEWLHTSEGDEIQCISIENLEDILSSFFGKQIKLKI